jgi:hypothetical protein
VALAGVIVLGMGTGAEQPGKLAPPPAPARPAAVKDKAVPTTTSLAEPLALVAKAKKAYAKVRDYSCTLVKREKVDGTLTPNHVIALKVRTSPFSVDMSWQEPKALAGQEVCYVTGKNNGEMRVRPAGLLGALGFVSISPDDERAKKTSKHRITEAGIGWVIEQYAKGWEMERKLGKTRVRVSTYQYAKRRCTRVELIHPTRAGGKLLYHRNVVYFDQQTHLPIRVENYDWPAKPGQPDELAEVFSFVNLRLNIDLPDSTFER